jgi:hypothetical protein
MSKRSKSGRRVLVTREQVLRQPTDRARLARLRAARDLPVDTGDIPEATPLRSDDARRGMLRRTIVEALNRHRLSGYGLWKRARAHCPSLSMAAVYEFLAGRRAIGLNYIEALMKALDLVVVPRKKRAG